MRRVGDRQIGEGRGWKDEGRERKGESTIKVDAYP